MTSPSKRLLAILLLALSGCAKGGSTGPDNPVSEAYRLMDKGENAKASLLLEKTLDEHPDSLEVRILLASSYFGQAGIDIYSIHTAFKDVLFTQSVSDRFLRKKASAAPDVLPSGADEKLNPKKGDPKAELAPIEKLIDSLDMLQTRVQKIISLLNRFPDIPRNQWMFLDSGLALLDPAGDSKDLALYRMLGRTIYLKSYIDAELLANKAVGRRDWLCNANLDGLQDSVAWVIDTLEKISHDFHLAFPDSSTTVDNFKHIAETLRDDVATLGAPPVPAGQVGEMTAQAKIRAVLGCDK